MVYNFPSFCYIKDKISADKLRSDKLGWGEMS